LALLPVTSFAPSELLANPFQLPTKPGITDDVAEEAAELPAAFIAFTVNVRGVPFVKPVTVAVRTLPTVTGLPIDGVTVYPVIADPPVEAGAIQETFTEFIPGTAETPVGAPGTVRGVTGAEAEEFKEVLTEFIAFTLNVYDNPFVRPVSVAVRTLPTVTGLPEDGVIVYPVIAEPPSDAGAVQETVADALPATAETPVGAPGAVMLGVTEAEAEEDKELPTMFVATTVNVTPFPLVRPVTVAVRTFPTVTVLPEEAVTVYPVIAEPPFDAGAAQETVADVLPATAETPVGAPGAVMLGVTEAEAEEDKESPTAFVAFTVNVRGVPLVNPVKLAVKTFPTVTGLPTEGVTVYPVIADPPFEAGAVQETVADALPATAETPVGAPATVNGVTEDDAVEAEESPKEFVAFTVNVIGVPLVNPVKLAVKTFPTVTGVPTDGVTVYPVMAAPPEAGAVQETVADALPATAETPVGVPGTVLVRAQVTPESVLVYIYPLLLPVTRFVPSSLLANAVQYPSVMP
jgi:hypothetical protein